MRLKQYDYSSKDAYFITICVKDRKRILSDIITPSVGVGAHDDPLIPQVRLTRIGEIVEKYLLSSENISGVKIDRYVIMAGSYSYHYFPQSECISKKEGRVVEGADPYQ